MRKIKLFSTTVFTLKRIKILKAERFVKKTFYKFERKKNGKNDNI